MKPIRRNPAFALAAIAASLAAGCASAPPKPQSMLDPQANFGAYRTFALPEAGGGPQGQTVSIVDGYIRNAIKNEMKRKGYVEAAAGETPDLRVEYEAAKAEKLKNNPFRIGVGVGGYGSHGGGSVGVGSPSVKNVTEGSLVIHVIDTARSAESWRSGVTREIGKGNVQQETVDVAVAEAFKDLPPRTAD
jgi:opacity protein-like surface antigen